MVLMEPLLKHFGPQVAFGVPGLLMAVATFVFWLGRHRFVHIPPGGRRFAQELFSGEGLGAVARLAVIYAFVAMFWALFDQTGSAWVLQATQMDRNFLGHEWLPSQIQASEKARADAGPSPLRSRWRRESPSSGSRPP